jgi:ubiquinone/menaquinone biosynthesis C-methylase UbiE
LYAKHVLPWLIEASMKNKEAARLRAASIPKARGEVLEIGIGSGLNLPYYSSNVRRVRGVDPSSELQRLARERMAGMSIPVEFLTQSADQPLPVADASIDTAVITWTLCSIPNARRALENVRRALRPDGLLIFLEHGRARDARVAGWQDRLTPIWKRFTGGCHLNREVDSLIVAAGFEITELNNFYLPGPRPMRYIYQGFARPA